MECIERTDIIVIYRDCGTYYIEREKKNYIQLPHRLNTKKQVRKYLEKLLNLKSEQLRICFEKREWQYIARHVLHCDISVFNYG